MPLGMVAGESFVLGSSHLILLAPASGGVEDCLVHGEGITTRR